MQFLGGRTRPRHGFIVSLLLGIAVLVAFIAVQTVAAILLTTLGIDIVVKHLNFERASVLIVMEVLMLIGALTMLRAVGGRAAIAVRDARARIGAGMLMMLPILVLGVALSVAVTAAGSDPLIDPDLNLQTGAALVLLAVLIAITEEVWFRGLMIAGLGGERRPWLAIIASSILFAAPHIDGSRASIANAGAVLLVIGVPFAVIRLLTHTLVPLIVCHAIVDTWAFLHTANVQATGSPSTREMLAGLILPALVAVGYIVAFTLSAHRRTTPPAP